MEITIHSVHFDADIKLEKFINSKINKLENYIDGVINSEVFLRLEKSQAPENKVVEIKMKVKGAEMFVKKQCRTFEEATDQSIDALKKQLIKHKEKKYRSL
ncbi:ribosome hibernation-promoting factor, HPF/YfiA family [Bacteroidota bacterium]